MTPPNEPQGARARGRWFKLLAVPLVLLSAVLGLGFAKWCRISCYEPVKAPQTPSPSTSLKLPNNVCKGWPKPDVVLVLSGQMHGYLLPCGCSKKQLGGLERRYNLMQILHDKGWDVVATDLGDLPQSKGPAGLPNIQGPLKYLYARRALDKMGYAATSIGEYEAVPSLSHLLDLTINDPRPAILAANLTNRADDYAPGSVGDWELAKTKDGSPRVGITAVVGPTVEEQIKQKDRMPKFGGAAKPLKDVLAKMDKEKVDLRVLLYEGYAATPNQKAAFQPEAIECAKAFPEFQVMLCLDEADEPPLNPLWINDAAGKPKTLVARVGHKSKHVALVGVYKPAKAGDPYTFRYENVELSEDYMTPEAEAKKQPIAQLMEDYTAELKRENYLERFPQVKHPFEVAVPNSAPAYVGTAKCGSCHADALTVWKKSDHSKAYAKLVDAQHKNPPGNRQFDAECIVCHTVGFGYKTGFQNEEKTKDLINVGCESCHGPGSLHVNDMANKKHDPKLLTLINPWRAQPNETPVQKQARVRRMDDMCQRCHDSDNDNTYTNKGIDRKWPLIQHYNDDKDKWPPFKAEEPK